MVFGIIILLFIGGIAFFHFVQGFFSATLSAIFAVIAAAAAISFHENVIQLIKPGKFADSANAVVLCSLFALTYLVLRLIFDRIVPGNVRLLPTIDKVGAAVMGIIAGIFATGIVAIAAQTMPFGPSVLGYARYAVVDRPEISFQAKPDAVSMTRNINDETKSETFKDEDLSHLVPVPVDDLVLNMVSTLSEGALSGDRKFSAIHQDYLQEAFGTRIGVELGAKHTATNFGNQQQVTVEKVGVAQKLKAVEDSELPQIRGKKVDPKQKEPDPLLGEAKLAKDLGVTGNQRIVIVRALFNKDATDDKVPNTFRFSPGAIRLVGHDKDTGKAKDYYPKGTMDAWGGGTFWPNRISDPLFVESQSGADLVFVVDDHDEIFEGNVSAAPRPKTGGPPVAASPETIKPGTFLEVKRLALVDLSGKSVDRVGEHGLALPPPDQNQKVEVMRKLRLKPPPPAQP